jgi:hypothetical protein
MSRRFEAIGNAGNQGLGKMPLSVDVLLFGNPSPQTIPVLVTGMIGAGMPVKGKLNDSVWIESVLESGLITRR